MVSTIRNIPSHDNVADDRSMDDGVLSRTNLPAAISIGIGTGLLGGIIAEFAIAYPNVPTPSAKVAPAALFGLILIAPWILRGIFTAGVQRWLETYQRLIAAVVTGALEASISVQPAFFHLSTIPLGGWDHAAEIRMAGAFALGPLTYAALRYLGAPYVVTVAANVGFFGALFL